MKPSFVLRQLVRVLARDLQLLKGLLERSNPRLKVGLSACRGGGFNEESLYFLFVLLQKYARCATVQVRVLGGRVTGVVVVVGVGTCTEP